MGHESVLRAVIRRAYEDLSLIYRKPEDSESQRLAEQARLWIFGQNGSIAVSPEDERLDDFMSFKNLCESLRLPYYEMITYAEKVVEGEHEQFRENQRAIVWSTDEYSWSAFEDNISIGIRAESVLRAERIISAQCDVACEDSRGSSVKHTEFGD